MAGRFIPVGHISKRGGGEAGRHVGGGDALQLGGVVPRVGGDNRRAADRALAARIPGLAQIIAFRNLLMPGYAVVDDGIVWRSVREDLPGLPTILAELRAELGQP